MKLTATRTTPSNGFTLIELLVVIAIIAILAAILFPVFGRARENARRSSCQSNLKQIALAVKQYIGDYDGNYPLAVVHTSGPYSPERPSGWVEAIFPYVKTAQLYQCPSDPNPPVVSSSAQGFNDYLYNAGLSWNGLTGGNQRYNVSVSEASLLFPSLTILNGDASEAAPGSSGRVRSDGCSTTGSGTTSSPTPCTAGGLTVNLAGGGQQHFDGANYSFADGHVKWYKNRTTNASTVIYRTLTPFSTSQNNPTFNVSLP